MTYDARETSTESGQPVELFEIALGTESWYMTDAEGDYTVSPTTYASTAISRSELGLGREGVPDDLTVVIPAIHPFPARYVNNVPGRSATFTLKRTHRGDTGVQTIYIGKVTSCTFSQDGSVAELTIVHLAATQNRECPRRTFQGLCNHSLFDSFCTVASSLFQHTNTVTSVVGNVITVAGLSAKGDGWATGGFIAIGSNDRRLILSHTGDDVTVHYPFPSSPLGVTVDVFAGCDRTLLTCSAKFGNEDNFGGHSEVPQKDIFRNGID